MIASWWVCGGPDEWRGLQLIDSVDAIGTPLGNVVAN